MTGWLAKVSAVTRGMAWAARSVDALDVGLEYSSTRFARASVELMAVAS